MLKNLYSVTSTQKRMAGYYREQLVAFESKKMPECAAWCEFYLSTYSSPVEAIELLKSAIICASIFDPREESELLATSFKVLGASYNNASRFEEGIRAYEKADKIWGKYTAASKEECIKNQADIRNNKAGILLSLGDIEEGIKEFDRALELKSSCPDYIQWKEIERNRQIAIQYENDPALSLQSADDIVRLVQGPGDISVRVTIAFKLGQEMQGKGRPTDARRIFLAAQETLQKDLNNASFQHDADVMGVKRLLLGSLLLENDNPKLAATTLEQAREELTKEQNENALTFCLPVLALAEDRAGQKEKAEQAFQAAVKRYEERLARIAEPKRIGLFQVIQARTLYADYADFLMRSDRAEGALLMADRARARGMARQAVDILASSSPSVAKDREKLWMDPLASREREALAHAHPDTLYLHYDIGRKGLMLFVSSDKGKTQQFTLTSNYPALLQKIDQWTKNLASQGISSAEFTLARDLGKTLLEPLYKARILTPAGKPLRWNHLVVIPDGGLHAIPFAALILPESGNLRLIDRLSISVTTSLRQLARTPVSATPKGRVFVVNDPTYRDLPEGKSPVVLGSDDDPPLKGFREVFGQLAARYPGAVKSLVGSQAREVDVLRLMSDYSLLIFATHGHANDEQSGLSSYLTLAPDKPGDKKNEKLFASKILSQPLSAKLAVLSACETAQGQLAGGEGNQGLVWAFWAAGCPSVVASLWKVDPNAAAQLFPPFLDGLKDRLPKDVTLQRAVKSLRAKNANALTTYWAASQVYGNVDPLPDILPKSSIKANTK